MELYDQAGTKTWQAQLDSYGQVRAGKGKPQDCPFRYQGQYEDTETGLYYNRFRYYAPEEGIYLSQDPIRLAGGNKLYGYVKDTNGWMDPLGLACGKATIKQFENGHPEGHFSIEITDGTDTLHTHQVITTDDHSATTIIQGTTRDLGPPANVKAVDIADATAAMDYQKSLMHTDLGPYDAISNSCLSHVADVINAGGGTIGKTRLGYAKFLRGNGFSLFK